MIIQGFVTAGISVVLGGVAVAWWRNVTFINRRVARSDFRWPVDRQEIEREAPAPTERALKALGTVFFVFGSLAFGFAAIVLIVGSVVRT